MSEILSELLGGKLTGGKRLVSKKATTMKKRYIALAGITMALMPIALVANVQDAQAQPKNCVYLREVSSGQISIEKKVSIRALGNNDWNTDFAVPTGTRYRYFMGHIYPQNNANYQVTVSLKYNDNTSSQVYKKSIPMQRYELYSGTFRPPTAKQPYQVNVNVGSDVNNVYSVAVLACQ